MGNARGSKANEDGITGEPPTEMTQLVLGLYRKGLAWSPDATPETIDDQRGHLANFQRLAKQGLLLLSGPISDGDPYRGLILLDCTSPEEAKQLMSGDPHLESGRLELDLYTWWTSTEAINRPLKIPPGGDRN